MKVILLFITLSSQAQIQMSTNTVLAAVDGVAQVTTDGTNWQSIPANMVVFNFTSDLLSTNDPPPPPVHPVGHANLMSIRSRLTNALTKGVMQNGAELRPNVSPAVAHPARPHANKVARSYSDSDTTDTWTVTCPDCQHKFNVAVNMQSPKMEVIK